MRRVSFHRALRRRRGQAVFVFMLGFAMVAMILANVFMIMEYVEHFHDKNDVLAKAKDAKDDANRDSKSAEEAVAKAKADLQKAVKRIEGEAGKGS